MPVSISSLMGLPLRTHPYTMRIAIMGIRGLPSTYSGYETFADALGSRLVQRGHDVLVYCRAALFSQHPLS